MEHFSVIFSASFQQRWYMCMSVSENDSKNIHVLTSIYQEENEIMQLVSQGAIHKIEKKLTNFHLNSLEQRSPNSLRNTKNYMIILNTLLRKAAEKGGLHPLQLHEISSHYAYNIELLHSERTAVRLAKEMIRKYTLLVKEHAMDGYSLIIRKTIAHITSDFTQNLTLQTLADLFAVSPSYLSHLFKKETGENLSHFINRKRIEHAVYLLEYTDLQIQQISHDCGYIDTCYFTKVFKKFVGKTPTEYRS